MNPIWLNAIRASGMSAGWWRAGGTPEPIAVWQPIGAASLEASYVNLVNPGTYDAAPGVAPTWASATGWGFDGTAQYLTTGVTPASPYSAFVRYSNSGIIHNRIILGSTRTTVPITRFYILPKWFENVRYGNGGFLNAGTVLTAGVLAIVGQSGYRNGALDGIITTEGAGFLPLFIGADNRDGTAADFFCAADIQAVAIYDSTLTAPQVAAVSAAMAALTG